MKLNKYLAKDRKEVIRFIQSIIPKSFKCDFSMQIVKDMDGRFYLLNDKQHVDHILKIKLLFLSALQQFQFWVNPNDNKIRTDLNSLNIHNLSNLLTLETYEREMLKLINQSVYLRKERLEIFRKSLAFIRSLPVSLIDNKKNPLESVDNLLIYLYNYDGFLGDPFHKKRNYFIMSVMRYFSIVLENNPNSEFKPVTELSVNPAIDYNIPPILDKIGIIKLSPEIKANIENSQVFYANSYTELVIRAYSYIAMLKFGKVTNLNQEVLDGNLFFNRANFEIKPLLCLTVNY
jgi:hypothetical protein